ncbi:MAG: ABC transporter ATP-binding protein [Anaerolineales bacterium]
MTDKLCADMGAALTAQGISGEPLIEMRDIFKIFKTGAGDFTALNGVDVCFYEGEFVSVVGKSGSGKSTLVNMLTGIDHPTSGSVRVGDTYIHQHSEGQMSIWRGANLGIIFQFFQLLPMLSILENVMLPMDFAKIIPFQEREVRAMQLLEMVGLQDYAHDLPAEVSGGQQQSAAIARSLANDPPIIIADEPTGNLDSRSADRVFEIFSELAQQGKTIIMVTHDSTLAQRSDRMFLLSDGELVNNWIANAFPELPHPRLLWLTHSMQPRSFDDQQPIPLPDNHQTAMYLFTSGPVEFVTRNGFFGNQKVRLDRGEYLALPDLQTFTDDVLGLRSTTGEPVEALVLDRDSFQGWMAEDQIGQANLTSAARQRVSAWRSNGNGSKMDGIA